MATPGMATPGMATKRRSEEHRLQAAVMEHYRLRGVRGALLFAIPNGGLRDKIVAAQLREEGVTGVVLAGAEGRGAAIIVKNGDGARIEARQSLGRAARDARGVDGAGRAGVRGLGDR